MGQTWFCNFEPKLKRQFTGRLSGKEKVSSAAVSKKVLLTDKVGILGISTSMTLEKIHYLQIHSDSPLVIFCYTRIIVFTLQSS